MRISGTWTSVEKFWVARLNTIHNLHYFQDLMREIRQAIRAGNFAEFSEELYRMQSHDAETVA